MSADRQRKRICIINTYYPPIIPGGAEVSVAELCKALADEYDVRVICVNTTNKRVEETIDGIPVVRLPALNVGHDKHYPKSIPGKILWRIFNRLEPLRRWSLEREIRRQAPDIVHAHNLGLLSYRIAPWLHQQGIKSVFTARDYKPVCRNAHMIGPDGKPCTHNNPTCRWNQRKIKPAFRFWDRTVGISSTISNDLIDYGYYAPERTQVIFNSILDLSAAAPASQAQYDAGFMGSMAASKGVDTFLHIARSLPEHRFCIATQSPQNQIDRFKDKIPPNVTLLGRKTPLEFFSGIRVCIMPTIGREGFGRVAAEAFSASRPALVSDRGGLTDIVQDGINGYVLPPEQPELWVAPLRRLLEDEALYNRFAQSARQRHQDCFTAEQLLRKHRALYSDLLQTGNVKD